MSNRRAAARVRHVLDDINHDDLAGHPLGEAPEDGSIYGRSDGGWVPALGPGDGIPEAPENGGIYGRSDGGWVPTLPEAPVTGQTYGRGGLGWYPVLPLAGGQLTGFLITTMGTAGAPGLMLGDNSTGFYRAGANLFLNVGAGANFAFTGAMNVSYQPLSLYNLKVINLADATADTDALNLRTADARYWAKTDQGAPVGPWQVFPMDPGWTGALRMRLVNGGTSLQIDGTAVGPIPANAQARTGILPAGFRPARPYQYITAIVLSDSLSVPPGVASIVVDSSDGGVYITPSSAMGTAVFSAIIALD